MSIIYVLQYSLTRIRLYIADRASEGPRGIEHCAFIPWEQYHVMCTGHSTNGPLLGNAWSLSGIPVATYYVSSSQRKKEATRKHYLPDTATGGKVTCLYYNYTIMPLCRLNNIEAVVRQRRGVALGLGCSWPCQDNSDKHVLSNLVSCCRLNRLSYQAVS